MVRAVRTDLHQHHITRRNALAGRQRPESRLDIVIHVQIAALSRLPPSVRSREVRQRDAPLARVPIAHQAVAIQDAVGKWAAEQRRHVALRSKALHLAGHDGAGIILGNGRDEPRQAGPLARHPISLTARRRSFRVRVNDGRDAPRLFRRGVVLRIQDEVVRSLGEIAARPIGLSPALEHHQPAALARVLGHRVSANGLDCLLAHGYPLMRSAEGNPPKLMTSYSPKRFLQSVSRPEQRSKAGSVTGRPCTSNMREPVYAQ
ncbi:hypothetical protein D3C86_1363860 [compost metagenome]